MPEKEPVVFEGMNTPWGRADSATLIIPGVGTVGTPSHGGIKLSRARQLELPEYMRRPSGWYEEDCEWALVFCALEPEICKLTHDQYALRAIQCGQHRGTLRRWYPDLHQRFYAELAEALR